ncbi:MAG: type II secretion system F family protein [Phycisphaerales bacterium]|nr:type II secretion system F family protein [Phycisphaerales bacterium]MCI0632087.1 type II secretion system F family protein [Phycisphaerales bacterium]MCI0677007.1 type II secretion system F family protein [Phycisphaerales bacterium]
MPTYQYEALNSAGKPQKGVVEAISSEEAIQRIKGQGYFPTSVREQKVKGAAATGTAGKVKKKRKKTDLSALSIGGVGKKKLTLFTRQLSTLQDAGLPLLRSLQILEGQQKPGLLKSILGGVVEDVEAGTTLSDAMAKHPKAFDRLYCKMVNAGEIGGVLDLILQRLANFMEKAQRLRRRIIGAMIYPTVVICIAVLIVTGIMIWVIPKFQDIFNDFDVELPGLTLWLIDTSLWVAGKASPDQTIPGWVWIIATPFLLFFFFKLIRKTGPGRAVTDHIRIKIPVVGQLVKKTAVARFTRTLGTLISAGVPILEAIMITRDTSGNYVYEQALTKVHDSIREGETFAGPLRESKVCDAIVVNMIDVGEETGDLDTMLMKIADNYDEEVDVAVQALLSLLEPMLVVVLGGIVGTIVLALFLPLVKMIESVSSGKV